MTEVEIYLEQNNIKKICVQGHANYADSGKDIVCAGISVLLQTGALASKKLLGKEILKECSDGKLIIEVPDNVNDDNLQLILQTIIVGLKDIESGYPKNLKIKEM